MSSEVATTGSDVARPARTRLRDLPPITKDEDLAKKHRLLAMYMVHGCDSTLLLQRVTRLNEKGERLPVRPGVPLTLEEAATITRMRNRTARLLTTQPAFQRLMARETTDLRNGAKVRAMHRTIALVDEPGDGKAADRKVQLQAAQAILGDEIGQPAQTSRPGVTVNVAVTPGYVIGRNSRDDRATVTIEAQAVQQAPRDHNDDNA